MSGCFAGIDVGTGSVRAGIFDGEGRQLAVAKRDIRIWKEAGDVIEQSSDDIWACVCACVKEAVGNAGIAPGAIEGIGFDATCSLVVLGPGGRPLPVGRHGDPERNVIVWMDHRATGQADRINALGSPVLDYVGGTISPEMETPKLLWLSEELPDSFAGAWQFLDLADFLTWKASGSLARSVCTVTCKWTYLAHEQRWDEGYFRRIGLGPLADEGFTRIGTEIVAPGSPLGSGLTPAAAAELGLSPGTAVAAGLIDAHAGGIGTVGARGGEDGVLNRMAYVFGTSACTLLTTTEPAFVPGVWGPYFSAMVPNFWLNEGGQSAAGAAIDRLVRLHPAAPQAREQARAADQNLSVWLAGQAEAAGGAQAIGELVGTLHVVPEFLGNRAPFADHLARGIIAGLGMDEGLDSLTGLYMAGLAGIGYGLRQILNAQAAKGAKTDTVLVSGGAGQSPLVRQVLADAANVKIAAVSAPEPVLLGSAILGAVAAGRHDSFDSAMASMSRIEVIYGPSAVTRDWHERRFHAFETLQAAYRSVREQVTAS
ncbi:FGGY-family carbohydrate kinase [Ancylobacter sp. MQZ15Z-1]|uniref:FGGY-family carbohydrate kinase n=1 Tax=Ancylobacter mangrovi TaxID=2972472 RepID=A0A9X2PDC2_9HYPH|nr:FGGY-family carbohydrate kinase [Ancylobacter mangrovi]MCS0494028.1 FGGY-family carbohydrate kinase [Ancylobacter mangrovi]